MVGITAFGAYIPKRRLQRSAIAAANTWFDASLRGHARGERSMCSWDEDAVTMAVEAGRDVGGWPGSPPIRALTVASTSLPFIDRQNAGIVTEALNLAPDLRTMDVSGSQRAGTTALLSALDCAAANRGPVLLIGSEHRRTRVGSPLEMLTGDGAAALVVGTDDVLAKLVDARSVASDFVDHFRADGFEFDYDWEERWIRDEGYLKLVPDAVLPLLEATGVAPTDVAHFILPSLQRRVPAGVARKLGIDDEALADNLLDECGNTGAAHPLVLLAHVLERAQPSDRILLVGFGQGCDALLFEATEACAGNRPAPTNGVSGWLEQRVAEENYAKFQTFNHLVEREFGKRAEVERSPALSAMYRNRKMVNGFIGGRCTACGTVQFPKATYCVSPNCGAANTQEDHPMSGKKGEVRTWTADRLVFDMNPPAYFGLVEFEGGGRAMVDFTDVEPENFDVGTKIGMHFRIKHVDPRRGLRSYFWKAAPE